jgi:hypothetical protein
LFFLSETVLFYVQDADAQQDTESSFCITYDSLENAIRINCESANMTGLSSTKDTKSVDLTWRLPTIAVLYLYYEVQIDKA